MRVMVLVKGDPNTEAGAMPEEKLIAAMADYHEKLAKAGVLLDGSGLQPSAKGWRIRYSGDKRTVVDGPFTEAKEVVGGYAIVETDSKEQAHKVAHEFMEIHRIHWPEFECECEVRPLDG